MRFYICPILLLIISCDSALIDADPEDTLEENFEVFWNEFDQQYPLFELKGIDWNGVYSSSQPRISGFANSTPLFQMMEEIVLNLQDGHVSMITADGTVNYDYTEGYVANSPKDAIKYVTRQTFINDALAHGDIQNSNLGYIKIKFFDGEASRFEQMDELLSMFSNKSGLVIDVRSNVSGKLENAKIAASRFADERRLFRRTKRRNGSGHSDFTDFYDEYIEPANSSTTYDQPVVVLTNRGTFGSAEAFVLAMRAFPNITILGSTTGGGSGEVLYRELPNEWIVSLPITTSVTPDMQPYDVVGLDPDVAVDNSDDDIFNRIDRQMEQAIEMLQ